MCRTYQFLHLCGHAHRNTMIPCGEFSSLTPQLGPAHLECPDLIPLLRLIPSLCKDCESISVISDWMKRNPEDSFEILQHWSHMRRNDLWIMNVTKSEMETKASKQRKGSSDNIEEVESSSEASDRDWREATELIR